MMSTNSQITTNGAKSIAGSIVRSWTPCHTYKFLLNFDSLHAWDLTLNPSVSVSALMTLIDFTLSNTRRFYSSMENPSDTEGLTTPKTMSPLPVSVPKRTHDIYRFYSVYRQTILLVNGEPLGHWGVLKDGLKTDDENIHIDEVL